MQTAAQVLQPVVQPKETHKNDTPLEGIDLMDRSSALSLANIRGSLIRQEDTIIFSLIERAQFSVNAPVYQAGKSYEPIQGSKTTASQQFLLLICIMSKH